ncbi:MAG: orotate phosphoribosyltransferase-like protein [Thermoplasmata archaeon]|nr:MAG: orotate phosphoribosyltransferase-like protein [Thermoplasmata archaeon]
MKSIDSLVEKVLELKKNGLSESEISDELHLSVATVTWLLTRNVKEEKPPADIKVGWRSIGVYGGRIGLVSSLFIDIILEEMEKIDNEQLDTVVGIAINGIPFATMVSEDLGLELSIYRPPVTDDSKGTFSSNYATLKGKNVVVVDDVVSTGYVAKSSVSDLKNLGANPLLIVVMVNKTPLYELDGVPLRSLIRARTIA